MEDIRPNGAQAPHATRFRGQAALEQLIVIGVAIAFTAIIFFFASSYSADSLRVAQAQDSVDRLAAAADYVYSLGPNSKDYVTVTCQRTCHT